MTHYCVMQVCIA